MSDEDQKPEVTAEDAEHPSDAPCYVPMDTGNLADDVLYKALDELYHRGWQDRNKERDYDPRGTTQWQDVLDLFRLQKKQLESGEGT